MPLVEVTMTPACPILNDKQFRLSQSMIPSVVCILPTVRTDELGFHHAIANFPMHNLKGFK